MFCARNQQNSRLASLLVLSFFLLLASAARPQSSKNSALDLDGRPVNPLQRAAGKVVVLMFVRTDCPVSNRYAPTIQQLSKQFRNAQFFLVYPIRSETPAQIRKHLRDYGYSLTAVRDPDLQLVRAAEVKVTPESAVFTADGKLFYHGRIDDWYADFGRSRPAPTTHELAVAIQAALEGKPLTMASTPAVGCFLPDTP